MRTVILFSVNDIAELLIVNEETVRKWIKEGKLKSLQMNSKKEGKEVMYEDLEEFLNKNYKYQSRFMKSLAIELLNNKES